MQKVAFKPGFEAEYKRRHDEIWEELAILIRDAGIRNYNIFLDPDSLKLFAVHYLDENNTSKDLAGKSIMKKWWTYMSDIMETNEDNSPVVKPLEIVFHMD